MGRISYLQYKDIDKEKWDRCIEDAENGLIFATSFFLDVVCDNWDGLVLGNYKAVMPLPWKKKYGLKYIIQPNYTKQLGVFGNGIKNMEGDFLKKIPLKFLFGNFSGNEKMDLSRFPRKKTQVIDFSRKPDMNKSTRKNIKSALKKGLQTCEGSYKEYLEQYKKLGLAHATPDKIKILERFSDSQTVNNYSRFSKVCDEDGRFLSVRWILEYNNRAYIISSATTAEGKKKRAGFLAFEHYFNHKNEKIRYLDFMGSEIPGVHEFNKGFGAEDRFFPIIRFNPLNRLKP